MTPANVPILAPSHLSTGSLAVELVKHETFRQALARDITDMMTPLLVTVLRFVFLILSTPLRALS
jgi:hypothetical protein